MKTYATDMQGVAVMLDMLVKEYFKALAAELSTNDKEDRLWVWTCFNNFSMCIPNNQNLA